MKLLMMRTQYNMHQVNQVCKHTFHILSIYTIRHYGDGRLINISGYLVAGLLRLYILSVIIKKLIKYKCFKEISRYSSTDIYDNHVIRKKCNTNIIDWIIDIKLNNTLILLSVTLIFYKTSLSITYNHKCI